MRLRSNDFSDRQSIPQDCAFGQAGTDGEPCVTAANRNPHLAWSDVPARAHSFVLTCVDSDAPSRADDVNKPGHSVPASLPRCDFTHWVMFDIAAEYRELAKASCSDGVVAHGKQSPIGPPGSKQGLNDYSGWFADDPTMSGDYCGYDGPCPPWNDELVHHYQFRIHALDVTTLGLAARCTLAEVRLAMRDHVIAETTLTGTYTLAPTLLR